MAIHWRERGDSTCLIGSAKTVPQRPGFVLSVRPSPQIAADGAISTSRAAILAVLSSNPALAGCFAVAPRDRFSYDSEALVIDDEECTPHFSHLSSFEVVAWDHETSSASTFGHPLEPYRRELSDLGLPDAQRLADRRHGDVSSYVGMVICRPPPAA